jgi:hypothetical protein
MRQGRLVATAMLAAALGSAACRDIPAPDRGVLSVSRVRLPSPGLVAGDTLRDSTGAVAAVRVIAYGVDGEPLVPQPPVEFIVDGAGAHLAFDSLLVGDQAGTRVGVLAAVGSIQTLPESVTVTKRPDTLVAADSTRHLRQWTLAGDTVVNSAELSTLVQHREGADTSGVDAVIVAYELISAPVGNGVPTIQIMSGNAVSARDTTTGGGRASRVARLRIAAFAGDLDSAVVRATASYRGASLGSVQFTIVFQRQ